MRIISKYKDYYDGVGAMYNDKTPIWNRKPEDHDFDYYCRNDTSIISKKEYYNYKVHIIGFCGKIYLAIEYQDQDENTDILYDMKEVDMLFKSNEDVHWNLKKYWGVWGGIKNFQDKAEKVSKNKDLLNIFDEYKTPQFTITSNISTFKRSWRNQSILTINGELKKYKFFKVMDSYTAYQELDMYIGNHLTDTEDPDMPVGDDVTIAQSKGFNKFSFRAEKGSKKRKQKKK